MLKEKNAVTIMDAACGTGVDSVMLIEEMGNNPGFHLTSCDFSDKMLKDALKTRWDRRREKPFFDWVIEEGNWLTLKKDVPVPGFGFDAIICMGNSFPNLMEEEGNFLLHVQPYKLSEFSSLLKGVFGTQQQPATHKVFGDFKELKDNPDPAFYIHMIEKPLRNPGA